MFFDYARLFLFFNLFLCIHYSSFLLIVKIAKTSTATVATQAISKEAPQPLVLSIGSLSVGSISSKSPPSCKPLSYYDSTAGAIAACGLIEIAKNVPEFEKDIYLSAAIKMLKAMEKAWCNWEENEDSVLQMGTERYVNEDGMGAKGLHIPIIYGDFFFAEAMLKLRGSDFLPW